MAKFKKKPVVIEAIKWDGTLTGKHYIDLLFQDLCTTSITYNKQDNIVSAWFIGTVIGHCRVSNGDYIIRGVNGEYYPCKPEIFEKTYDAVND